MNQVLELFRHEGAASRSIQLAVSEDGAIVLDARDAAGASPMFGDHRRHAVLTIPPEAIARLAFALLAERYRGLPNAVEAVRDLCRSEGLPHTFTPDVRD
jgi:hypothetical protein